uniref:Uncharacterized protein n=1 Tax=uncultured Desulfobacterium sp. TaxID=201089 RepID=E1YEU6_9BACT|nr:hypothetical protein N47_J00710 [uncultured Desulfobacterium sp.]
MKKSGSVLCEGVAARCAMIKKLRLRYSVPLLHRILDVSISGYYAWLNRKPPVRSQEEGRLEVEVVAAHNRTRIRHVAMSDFRKICPSTV